MDGISQVAKRENCTQEDYSVGEGSLLWRSGEHGASGVAHTFLVFS